MITVKELRAKLSTLSEDLYVTAIRDVLCVGWKNPDDGTLMIDKEIDVPNPSMTYRGIPIMFDKDVPPGQILLLDGNRRQIGVLKV